MDYFTRGGSKVSPEQLVDFDDAKGAGHYRHTPSCSRCGGAGASDRWIYTGRTCFDCGGTGKAETRTDSCYTAERLAKLNAARDAKLAKQAAAAKAAADAKYAAATAAFATWIEGVRSSVDAILTFAPDFWPPVYDDAESEPYPNPKLPACVRTVLADIPRKVPVSDRVLDVALSIVVQRLAGRDQRAGSQHVGTVGERREFTTTVDKVLRFDYGSFPTITTWLHLMRDAQGNRIVYKGSKCIAGDGDQITFVATVKEHNSRDGEAQTIVQRPKVK